jgi:DNA-binding NtrC family response regulator
MPRVLVIEDDLAGRRLLQELFTLQDWQVDAVGDGAAGLELAQRASPDLVVLDLRLPGMDGLEVLGRLQQLDPHLPVIISTADNDVRSAVLATKRGAFDYLTKPLNHEQLQLTCQRALELRALRLEVDELRNSGSNLLAQMGGSPVVATMVAQVRKVAPSELAVLITGETGAGKELVAQALHRKSNRRERPLLAIDCGAIPESVLGTELFTPEPALGAPGDDFLSLRGGTLFLDEVGNLSHSLQARLARTLELRTTSAPGALDMRLVATTHFDLPQLSREGLFRTDLYARLAEHVIHVPALRERRDDIPYLAQRFLEEVSVELRRPMLGIAPEALGVLASYDWPGNVRELRNVVRQAALGSNELTLRAPALAKHLVLDAADGSGA